MPEYNLTPGLRELLRELVQTSRTAETEKFAFFVNSKFTGAVFETESRKEVKMGRADLNVFINLDMISFEDWNGRGILLQSAFDAVRNDFRLPDPSPSVSIEQALFHHPGPIRRNLTMRQKEILREIVKASRAISSEQFFFVEDDGGSNIVFLSDQGMNVANAPQVGINSSDLHFLSQDFLHLDPDPASTLGSVLQAAFDAVDHDFAPPFPIAPPPMVIQKFGDVNTGGGHFQANAGHHNTQAVTTTTTTGENSAMLAQLVALTAELIGAMKIALPIEQHDAAAREAQDLVDELRKERPDLITVEGKARGVWQRLGTGMVSFVEGAGKIADAVAKFSPWLVAAGDVAKSMMH